MSCRENNKMDMEKENIPPEKRRVSLSLKKKNNSARFGKTSEETLKSFATLTMPKNSARSSKWATTNLKEWYVDYNSRNPDTECPVDILSPSCSEELLNKWLCVYVVETRNQDGNLYPPKTVYTLVCGILREMRVAIQNTQICLKRKTQVSTVFMLHSIICLNHYIVMVLALIHHTQKGSLNKKKTHFGSLEFLILNLRKGCSVLCSITVGNVFVCGVDRSIEICLFPSCSVYTAQIGMYTVRTRLKTNRVG